MTSLRSLALAAAFAATVGLPAAARADETPPTPPAAAAGITWLTDVQAAGDEAKAKGRPILMEFMTKG